MDEIEHECKLCRKSFPCGKSLGGHMRSHLSNSSADSEDWNHRKPRKVSQAATGFRHDLREKPKKKIGGNPSWVSQPCRECGRRFGSWKGLFDHMTKHHLVDSSHSSQEEEEEEDGEFWSKASSKLAATDSQSSENETGFRYRKRRSQRRKRYNTIKALNCSSSSLLSAAAAEHELEEVAVSLMMLSRDSFNGSSGTVDSSIAESSGNDSIWVLHEDQIPVARTELSVPTKRKFSGRPNNDFRPPKSSSKKLITAETDGSGLEVDQNLDNGSSRFECTTCNKIFQSYQALGGHRASHSKSKLMSSASKDNDSLEADISQSPLAEITAEAAETDAVNIHQLKRNRKRNKTMTETEGDEHECGICLRVFTSGQALGGHKRSHMPTSAAASSDAKTRKIRPVALPGPPTPAGRKFRDFLDLNLPAPPEEDEEEEESSSSIVNFRSWWAGRSHKQDPLIGLIA